MFAFPPIPVANRVESAFDPKQTLAYLTNSILKASASSERSKPITVARALVSNSTNDEG